MSNSKWPFIYSTIFFLPSFYVYQHVCSDKVVLSLSTDSVESGAKSVGILLQVAYLWLSQQTTMGSQFKGDHQQVSYLGVQSQRPEINVCISLYDFFATIIVRLILELISGNSTLTGELQICFLGIKFVQVISAIISHTN